MSKPTRCEECGQKTVVPKVLATYSADLDHDGRKYHVEVPDLDVYQCAACGEIEMDSVSADRVYFALRKAVGVLPAAEIRRRREQLGLSQETLASLLGVAVATFSRWEAGVEMPRRCMDNMLRAFFDVPELRDFLARRASRDADAPAAVSSA